MERVALIPARGGSQRIPRKNIKSFLGVPILSRIIETLEASDSVDRIVVSTDDQEFADIARRAGADVPFMRPGDLADNHTSTRPVIQHGIDELDLADDDVVVVMYPTAVMTTPDDLRAASSMLLGEESCEFVLSVAEFPAPVQRALHLSESGEVSPREPEHLLRRSQDLRAAYYDIGQFYWGRVGAWRSATPVVQAKCRAYVVDQWRAVDIDTPDDWTRAEMVYRVQHA
ncbi:MAG: pseudaminic acid cytidylyltransferase [Brachybacterium sp.]